MNVTPKPTEKERTMSKLAITAAVAVAGIAVAAAAWQFRYQLYGHLPSTNSSELTNVNGQ